MQSKLLLVLGALLLSMQLVAFQEGTAKECGREPTPHPCACARMMKCPMRGEYIDPDDLTVPGAAKCFTTCKPKLCFCCKDCAIPKKG